MVFKDLNEFSNDLTEKILAFISTDAYEPNIILAVVKSYLHETKSIKEIDDFDVKINNGQFDISLYKGTVHKFFTVNPKNELRKRKLKIIKDKK